MHAIVLAGRFLTAVAVSRFCPTAQPPSNLITCEGAPGDSVKEGKQGISGSAVGFVSLLSVCQETI